MIKINIDGACSPVNPGGYAGYGAVIVKVLKQISGFINQSPDNSNNVAEYMALIEALNWLKENKLMNDDIEIRSDSKLVINQMQGIWEIKEGLYFDCAVAAKEMLMDFPKINFKWIPRELNADADELSKAELKKVNR